MTITHAEPKHYGRRYSTAYEFALLSQWERRDRKFISGMEHVALMHNPSIAIQERWKHEIELYNNPTCAELLQEEYRSLIFKYL